MTIYKPTCRDRDARGLLTTELAIMMPVMVVIALVAVFAINVERHGSRTQQAADAAARAASLQRTPELARSAAQRSAEAVCHGPVTLESVEFVAPDQSTFTPGSVRVVVTCTEGFSGFQPLVGDSSRSKMSVAIAAIEYWQASS